MGTLQLGGAVAAPGLGFLTSSAALQKKNNTQKPGQLLKSAQWSAPEGGRERQRS